MKTFSRETIEVILQCLEFVKEDVDEIFKRHEDAGLEVRDANVQISRIEKLLNSRSVIEEGLNIPTFMKDRVRA